MSQLRSEWDRPPACPSQKPVLITGGAGFIGTNLAHRLLASGRRVLLYDNLSRPGVEENLKWLREHHGERCQVMIADVRDRGQLRTAVQAAGQVFHLAAQVAVTASLTDPALDFEVNARGTLNLLEELRALDHPAPLVFTSTNKVYGDLADVQLRRNGTRYFPVDPVARNLGIGESRGLSFHSPYGCSKGAADQYVSDYARVYGLPAVVFRMSCIYGPHQFGTEDQGWVAHFLIRALEGRPITIYGDGMQVRDVLFVDDLIDAFLLAQANIERLSGQAFNIGGGPAHTISLIELVDLIDQLQGERPRVRLESWRAGDQRYYISDLRRFQAATSWMPRTSVREGVQRLHRWLKENFRNKYRKRPLPVLLEELEGLRAHGIEYVYFIDEIFLPDRALLEALVDRPVKFGVQTRIDLWKPDMLELLGRAGCVSIEAGVESITEEGRNLLDKNSRLTTREFTARLIFAKRHVPFVQANLLDAKVDDPDEIEEWREHLHRHGVWANKPVPLFLYPGSPGYTKRWGLPDDRAWERALEQYLDENSEFSDIQEERPLRLKELERC